MSTAIEMTRNARRTRTNQQFKANHRFVKEEGRWYIDLPGFIEEGYGSKGNLEMVLGADTMCDILSGHTDDVSVEITLKQTPKTELVATRIHNLCPYGRYYRVEKVDAQTLERSFVLDMWLCPVTKYVFGGSYPKTIYLSKN
jgi:hypothetical protein